MCAGLLQIGTLAPFANGRADRSFPAVLGFGALLAIVQGAFDFTGGKMTGYARDAEVDEYERTEQLRRNKRRPIEETLHELGEGRGRSTFGAIIKTLSAKSYRYIRPRLPRTAGREVEETLWDRYPSSSLKIKLGVRSGRPKPLEE